MKTYKLGTLVIKDYYVVFDMTPYDERNENYIQIGIGKKNTDDVIGLQHYEPSSVDYSPEEES